MPNPTAQRIPSNQLLGFQRQELDPGSVRHEMAEASLKAELNGVADLSKAHAHALSRVLSFVVTRKNINLHNQASQSRATCYPK